MAGQQVEQSSRVWPLVSAQLDSTLSSLADWICVVRRDCATMSIANAAPICQPDVRGTPSRLDSCVGGGRGAQELN